MANKVLVTVGITVFDRLDCLRIALNSALAQTYSSLEIIVSSDNPSLKIREQLVEYADYRIKWLECEKNMGEVYNINRLISSASGEKIIFIADDDVLHPRFVELCLAAMERDNVNCVYTGYQSRDELFFGIQVGSDSYRYTGKDLVYAYLSRRIKLIGCYALYDVGFLRGMGGMMRLGDNGHFSPYSDNLMALSLIGYARIGYVPYELIFYRVHNESATSTSADFSLYMSAQLDLIKIFFPMLDRAGLPREKECSIQNLLLKWLMADFLSVYKKAKSRNVIELFRYARSMFPSSDCGLGRAIIFLSYVNRAIKVLLR